MKFDKDKYISQLRAKYGDRRAQNFAQEEAKVLRYVREVSERLADTYTLEDVLAVGGTGIVLKGHHNRFNRSIVVKVNRPDAEAEGVSMVENEAGVLPTLSHPNIISVLDLRKLCNHGSVLCDCENARETCDHSEECATTPKLTYIVEPFISGSKPFFTHDSNNVKGTWLYRRIEELKRAMPAPLRLGGGDDAGQATERVALLLDDIAALFSQWISLLSHVHSPNPLAEEGYVYLDVKPENVLVDEHGHLMSIDFGSVEKRDGKNQSPVEVFFTKLYAHPELIRSQSEKPSSNRVRASFKRSKLRPAFDYYALGISMLQILHEIAEVRPHVIPQLPLYRSLHFLSTRLLDGRNSPRKEDNLFPYASQVFPGLHESDYSSLKYENLDDALRDLDKERGRWNLEDKVPELATYSKDIVRVVPGFNTVLTPRLRGVIEHPLVSRLKYVTQLGLVSLVYPTADHSRYDHALGSYTYTTYYVKSLFNDLGNPLFRNLVGTEDVNAVLLAALLHDLGQYPLAHDLEEVQPGIFKHGLIGKELLKDTTQDQRGRTLLEIITDRQNGWGVKEDTFQRIFRATPKGLDFSEEDRRASLKTDVLAAIIDGQVDADKADYIIRDSVRCELPYGAQLDMERLLRVLTVAILPEEQDTGGRVTLGVYDKGLVSAHAFGQARYQLLSTVYWHHTARIIKAMLQYATAMGLPLEAFGPKQQRENIELEIRERLLKFVKSLVPPFTFRPQPQPRTTRAQEADFDLAAEPPEEVIAAVAGDEENNVGNNPEEEDWYPGIAWTDWLMLRWVAGLPEASPQSRNLIHGIQTRRLYKRVATFTRGGPHKILIERLDKKLLGDWPARVDLCRELHRRVYERLSREWDNLDTKTTITKSDFEKLCESHLLILVDIPDAPKKIGYARPLGLVPELREKAYQQDTRQAAEDEEWRKIMADMVKGIAPVRVLCHPGVRNLVSSIYSRDNKLETAIANLLNESL